MLTIEAWDYGNTNYMYGHEIDVIINSVPFEETENKINTVQFGTNGIGWFNYSYSVQNSDSKNAHQSSIDPVATTVSTSVTNPLPTSSTCIASVPVDNSTDLPLAVSPSSLWALIAVAIMLLLTLLVTIIIAICVVKNMSMKLKETKERPANDSHGEHTRPVLVHIHVLMYMNLIHVHAPYFLY